MPVAIAKMFGSKMMSSAGKPTRSVRILYARSQMETLRAAVSAWPCSSNAITITAAPYRRTSVAWRMNSASPSFIEIELTTPLPWRHLSPVSITFHFDESSMNGTRAIAGSVAARFRNFFIAASASSIPSSKLMSMITAPASTCWRATSSAAS